jgi:protein-S-isoprenylcysteine O-methyltransferase Ste14
MLLILKNLLFTLVVPGTIGVYVPLLLVQSRAPASGVMFYLALALLATGGVLYAWCVWDFAVFGRGTPAPIDAPKRLVVRGLYRHSRNPIYVGVLTALAGWAVLFGGTGLLLYALSVAICFHLFVVLYEEPRLRRQFGAEYRAYCESVDRWLPSFRKRKAASPR